MASDERVRCSWPAADELQIRYHDEEWGVPLHDDRKQFEFLTLEAFQSGLSWRLILGRRERFRAAFDRFDPELVARYGAAERERLLGDAGIIRNRAKIDATINNAGAFLELARAKGGFSRWLWDFVGGEPVVGRLPEEEVPAQTELSRTVARELKGRGFKFLGPTVVYSHLQATGVVNDHDPGCFRHAQLKNGAK